MEGREVDESLLSAFGKLRGVEIWILRPVGDGGSGYEVGDKNGWEVAVENADIDDEVTVGRKRGKANTMTALEKKVAVAWLFYDLETKTFIVGRNRGSGEVEANLLMFALEVRRMIWK